MQSSSGEMLNGRPAFPGTSTMNQIERIVEVTGMPPKADVEAVSESFLFPIIFIILFLLSSCVRVSDIYYCVSVRTPL